MHRAIAPCLVESEKLKTLVRVRERESPSLRAEAVAYMCTLLIWKNRRPGHPIVIAANRDEFEGRAASPPRELVEHPLVVGGRDDVAGGTWLGISEYGIVVALTNRRRSGKHDPSKRSRGQLVLELAQHPTVAAIRAHLEHLDPHAFNPFVLVAIDVEHGMYAQTDTAGLTLGTIPDGVHAVTNWEFDATSHPKGRRALELAKTFDIAAGSEDQVAARLHALLSDHAPGERERDGGLCVHRPDEHYGTRSSTIVMLADRRVRSSTFSQLLTSRGRDYSRGGDDIPRMRYYAVEGHPCENYLSDVTALLRQEDAARAGVEP